MATESLTDDLLGVLQTAGVGTGGVDLFAGILPDLPDGDPATGVVAVLGPYASEPAVRAMGPTGTAPALEGPRVQVVARAADYVTARDKAQAALEALDWWSGTAGGRSYVLVEALQRPAFWLERDANDRHVFAFNCAVQRAGA